jgi:hypothetical protein
MTKNYAYVDLAHTEGLKKKQGNSACCKLNSNLRALGSSEK